MLKAILFLKKLFPQTLLGRSLIILVAPLILMHVIFGHIYFDRHVDDIIRRLSQNIAGEISLAIEWMETSPYHARIQKLADKNLNISIRILPKDNLDKTGILKEQWLYHHLQSALIERLDRPFFVSMTKDYIVIQVKSKQGVIECSMPHKKLYSRTFPLVLIWTSISAVIFFIIASIFMRNQIRPIIKLAKAADAFGRGEDDDTYKPEGAKEVRRAGMAFMMMRQRIRKLLHDRMQMLAGVSHDMRTPLTRLMLQVSLLPDEQETQLMKADLNEMRQMLDAYLDYARGTLTEKREWQPIGDILRTIAIKHITPHFDIQITCPQNKKVFIKPQTFNRLLTNLIVNSSKYGTTLHIKVTALHNELNIILDDNGPGIPESERENVFKPFYKLDTSRSQNAGGSIGLGLSIVRDAIRDHGGHIQLKESSLGGLRVHIRLPLKGKTI